MDEKIALILIIISVVTGFFIGYVEGKR